MCGIAGLIDLEHGVSAERLKPMTDALAHRGPDGEGRWISPASRAGLGHRRLSILDLSERAAQPMVSSDGRYVLTYNGEIYNYLELRERLEREGHRFRTTSDTEVLLVLYQTRGADCLEQLDGMFSFAVWDESAGQLFCARDRFGEKPFYYTYVPGRSFWFASEMKALFAAGHPRSVNARMLYNFLRGRYFITNPSDKSETFFQGIHKLEASHYLILDASGNLRKHRWYDLDETRQDRGISMEEACERYRSLFRRSVNMRLRSDVPVGSSLSGGLDSSSIVCQIAELGPLHQATFSARFQDYDRDEGPYIDRVVQATGASAHFAWPSLEGFLESWESLLEHQEEPFPTASIYAQWEVMRLAREEKVTVLLDGQGGDEILAGYSYYIPTLQRELEPVPTRTGIEQVKDLLRPVWRKLRPAPPASPDALSPEFVRAFGPRDRFSFAFEPRSLNEHLKHSLFVNNLEDLLRFSDRNAMAHSREVRLPFLSHELVEFVFSLPATFKIRDDWTKYVLRRAMSPLLPPEITWRKDKVGYEVPQARWMESPLLQEQVRAQSAKLVRAGILAPSPALTPDTSWVYLLAGRLLG